MQNVWKAGWSPPALAAGAALVLLAATAANSLAQSGHPRRSAAQVANRRAEPLPTAAASLDRGDPAVGYATALWSGGTNNQVLLVHTDIALVPVPVAYHVRTVFSPQIALGIERVARPGVPGQAVESVRRVYRNNRVVTEAVVGEQVVRPPQNEIVAVGVKLPEVSRGQLMGRVVKTIQVVATAYWADPSWSNGRTATGVPARYGVVAVDPSVIPLGTRLYIPGYGYGVAADTGGAIVGDRIDLCFDTGAQAIGYGRQAVTVYVLSN